MARSVKSRAFFGLRLGGKAALVLASSGLLALLSTSHGVAGEDSRPLLFGGAVPVEEGPVLIDPLLPRGELRLSPPPPSLGHRRCSLKRPVCVVGDDPATLKASLPLLENAYERVHWGAQRPIDASPERPITWYLSPAPLQIITQARFSRGFDRAWAFCQGGSPTQTSADRCMHEVTVAQLAPATASDIRRGFGRQQTWMLGHDPAVPEKARTAQRWPEAGVAGTLPPRGSIAATPVPGDEREQEQLRERSLVLFDFLHDLSQKGASLDSSFYGVSLAATTTDAGALRFDAEPDVFDVLRASLGRDRLRFARFLDELGRTRFLKEYRGLGTAEAPRLAWEIEASSLPRSLALPRPMLPTGSSYILLKKSQGKPWPDHVAFRIYCETPVSYVWSVTRLDGGLSERSFVPIAFKESDPTVEQRVGELEGSEALLLTGTNVGGVDLTHPFDPDHGPHEAHGCSVAINPLEVEQGNSTEKSGSTEKSDSP